MWRSRFFLPASFLAALAVPACSRDATDAVGGPLVDAASKPPTPHVWLHYDYLVYPDGHSDAPDPAAIQMVVDVYAAHGIVLEIDNHHAAVPSLNPYVAMGPICGALDIGDVKAQYFHPTSNHEWHYALLGDWVAAPEDCRGSVSGYSEFNGDNFVIGMERIRHFGPSPFLLASTVMHELGHNLGLHHGGAVDENYKPNYLSIMNYAFQFSGIRVAASPGDTAPVSARLDYSEFALPPLDENHLDERVGLGGPANDADLSRFSVIECVGDYGCYRVGGAWAAATGPVDWNRNGVIESDVQADLNFPPGSYSGAPSLSILQGFDDWAEVRGYILGTIAHGPKTIAHEDAAEQPIVSGIWPTTGPASGATTVTISGTHLGKATEVLFGVAGPAARFKIVNVNTIVAVSPPYPYPNGGSPDVTVVSGENPSPSVAADAFIYPPWPVPVVQHISPSAGPVTGGTTITITGSGLLGASGVRFGATSATSFTVIDDSTIRAVSPGGAGYADVRVTTGGGTSAFSYTNLFHYLTPPVVQGISPTIGFEAGGTAVAIQINLGDDVTGVFFGASPAASFTQPEFTFPYYTIRAISPLGTGAVDVVVVNAGGTSAAVAADLFTYVPTVTITGISPASGPGGTVVTIRGLHLRDATDVFFGPVSASFSLVDDSTLVASAPGRAIGGTVAVWIGTLAGATNSVDFTYPD